jgi:predicted RNase H-like nuclease (RuvC/YqgF family)
VLQREAMKIKQKTNPQLNHARQKIISQEKRVRELEQMDTEQHAELRDLQRGIFEYGEMIKQLRSKMQQIDFKKHRERLYTEKLGMINQGKKDDL